MEKQLILKQYFGHTGFRQGQAELIDNILSGRDALGIMPTGAGKSICYQVPALIMEGITLVISPLISLMKDQVNALTQSGVSAAYINSSLTPGQYAQVYRRASEGRYKIIYVAPERLATDEFIYFAERTKVSMVTVDEAHCVSHWGQDFRPSYLKIVDFIQRLSYRPIVSAFTATATSEVREDVIDILRLDNPFIITTGFDRKNLYFEVRKPRKKFGELLEILGQDRDKSGIVYCATRKTVEEVCSRLSDGGFSVTRYHAGLSDAERQANQDDFLYDRKRIMIATNAFGMGIDKSDVSFVVHYNMPKNLESYYQEAGRAGRDGEDARCILLYSGQDVRTNLFFIEHDNENDELSEEVREEIRQRDRERLRLMTFYCTTGECLRWFILRYFGETSPSFCGNCSNCNTNFETADITVEAQKIISCVYRVAQLNRSFGKTMIADILHGSKNEKIKRFGLDRLSTYGIMSDMPMHRIRSILDFLIENRYLSLTNDEYPVVTPAERSAEIIRDKKEVSMKLPKEVTAEKAKEPPADHDVDAALFAALKQLRSQLAAEARVPAYVIFGDAALRDMCRKLPVTKEEFLTVSGVGQAKMEKYAGAFTSLIKKHLLQNAGVQSPIETVREEKEIGYREKLAAEGLHSAYNPWDDEEDEQLAEEYEGGLTIEEISKLHNRTKGAINSRLKRLDLM